MISTRCLCAHTKTSNKIPGICIIKIQLQVYGGPELPYENSIFFLIKI